MLACCVKDRGSSCGRASMRLYPRASFLAYGSSARCAGRRTLSFFTVAKEENDESDEDENEDEDEDEDEELGRNKGRSAERGIVTQQSNEASPDGRFRGRWLLLTLGARYCPWLVNRHRQKKKQMQKNRWEWLWTTSLEERWNLQTNWNALPFSPQHSFQKLRVSPS